MYLLFSDNFKFGGGTGILLKLDAGVFGKLVVGHIDPQNLGG